MPKTSIKALEAKLKRYLYPLIKKRDGPICICCGKHITNSRDFHAGHFAKAELCSIPYRYDERNINTSCAYCNLWLRGNTLEYRKGMVKKYGEEITKEIEDNYNKPLPINFDPRTFLEEKIQYYKSLDSLENHGIQKTM